MRTGWVPCPDKKFCFNLLTEDNNVVTAVNFVIIYPICDDDGDPPRMRVTDACLTRRMKTMYKAPSHTLTLPSALLG